MGTTPHCECPFRTGLEISSLTRQNHLQRKRKEGMAFTATTFSNPHPSTLQDFTSCLDLFLFKTTFPIFFLLTCCESGGELQSQR